MPQEDLEGSFTEMALGSPQGQQMPVGQAPQGPRHGLYVEFYMHAEEDAKAVEELAHEIAPMIATPCTSWLP